jgi:NADH:ubiquinone oxidoreductase subunit F (NADH-binding)
MTEYDRRPPAGSVPRVGHMIGRVGGGPTLDDHLRWYGPSPRLNPGELTPVVAASGLTGRGGAAFPTARKLEAVRRRAGRRRPVVVANAAEGEPASGKDRTLLALRPNLVLDGLQLAAAEVGAERLILYAPRGPGLVGSLEQLLGHRARQGIDARPVEIVEAPPRFLAGEESALASRVGGGLALPRFTPPRVFEAGVAGAPTLVQNVETLAHLALLARFGDDWFRSAGLPDEPGTMLATVHDDTSHRVVEAGLGTSLTSLVGSALDADAPRSALLVGGYHGIWLPAETARGLRLANADLRPLGGSVGAGVVAVLPPGTCGLVETARVVRYLAAESAGQCGPCLNGLPAIAGGLEELAGPHPRRRVVDDLQRWSGMLVGRGACHHPDGTVRLVRSALEVFASEIDAHRSGRCTGVGARPFLPLPVGAPTSDADWV